MPFGVVFVLSAAAVNWSFTDVWADDDGVTIRLLLFGGSAIVSVLVSVGCDVARTGRSGTVM